MTECLKPQSKPFMISYKMYIDLYVIGQNMKDGISN